MKDMRYVGWLYLMAMVGRYSIANIIFTCKFFPKAFKAKILGGGRQELGGHWQ